MTCLVTSGAECGVAVADEAVVGEDFADEPAVKVNVPMLAEDFSRRASP